MQPLAYTICRDACITYTYARMQAQRTVETPPASPVPSVSLSVLYSRAQTGPQQSWCEISCLCRALSACTFLFGCTTSLVLDAYLKHICWRTVKR